MFSPIKTHLSPIKCVSVKGNRRVRGKSSSFVLMRSSLCINADDNRLSDQGVNSSLGYCAVWDPQALKRSATPKLNLWKNIYHQNIFHPLKLDLNKINEGWNMLKPSSVIISYCLMYIAYINDKCTWPATRLHRNNVQPERQLWVIQIQRMKKHPWLMRETYQHSPTTVGYQRTGT